MKLLALAIALIPAAATCSSISNYVILNGSDHPVTVSYLFLPRDSADPYCRCPEGFVFRKPVMWPDSAKLEGYWSDPIAPLYKLNNKTGEIMISLPPHSALKVVDGGTGGFNPNHPEWFDLQMLRIRRGDSILLELEGNDVLPAFRKTKRTLYLLRVDTLDRSAR